MTMTVYLILGLLLCVSVALNMHLLSRLQAEAEQDYYKGVPAWQDPAKILSLEEPGWIDAEELEPQLHREEDHDPTEGETYTWMESEPVLVWAPAAKCPLQLAQRIVEDGRAFWACYPDAGDIPAPVLYWHPTPEPPVLEEET